jgi:NADH:ubiquinone oxidoreductase subunit K
MLLIHSKLILSSFVFVSGLIGIVLNRDHLIKVLLSIELMLIASFMNFIFIAHQSSNINLQKTGLLTALFVLVLSAIEAAISLSLLVLYFKYKKTISIETLNDKETKNL